MPRAIAVSGIIFAGMFIACLVLIRIAVPADPKDPGGWLVDQTARNSVRLALNLIPFTGIAFLYYMGVLRHRLGLLEDRFFATVFLGSGLLFVATLFGSAVVAEGLTETFARDGQLSAQSETYAVARRVTHLLMITYAMKMAATFVFVTSTIGFRTSFLPRWLALSGFAVGLILLLSITDFAWIALLFPMWVLLVSAYILIVDTSPTQTP